MGVRLDQPRQEKAATSFDDKRARSREDFTVVCNRLNRLPIRKYAPGKGRESTAIENLYMTKKN